MSGKRDEDGAPLVPDTGMLDADRLLGRCANTSARASATTACAPLPPTAERVADPAHRQPHAVLLLGCPHNREHPGPEAARSSAAASAATRWSP